MKRIRATLPFLAILFCLGTVANAQPNGSGNGTDSRGRLSRFLTLANIPDVAECRGVALTQAIVDSVNVALEDPAETFEKWRMERRSMIEESPAIECQSKLWQALQRGQGLTNVASVPPGTEGFNLRPAVTPEEAFLRSLMPLRPDAASIGSNVVVAGGVENYQGEMQIAVNPNNQLQLVAGANHFYADPNCLRPGGGATNGTQAFYGSSDGGATWTYKCAPWPSDITGSVSGAAFFFGSDPALAWDNSGNAYAAYMLLNCNSAQTSCGYSIVVAKSSNVGQSWVPWGTVVNHSGDNTHGDDKEMIAVDNSPGPASTKSHPGRVYVIWDDLNVERVAFSDNGTSWTTVILPSPNNAIGGNVVVGSDGTVYVIWNRLNDPELIVFSKSVDGGNTWTTPVTAASSTMLSFGTNNKPPAQESRAVNAFGSLAMDSNPASAFFGRLYIVYNDFPTGTSSGTDINIYLVSSADGGVSWSPRVKVNDDVGTATQIFPWVAVDQTDGSVNVSWYDTRIDTANNRKTQVFYARSSNGGVSFEPNMLVTDSGGVVWRNAVNYSDENTTDNASRNGNQYGDYAGIAAINRRVHPFWMDSRNFFPTADTVSPTRREDAASAIIINCAAPSAIAAPSVLANCAAPRVTVSWSAPASWGTNATNGTYSVYRATTPVFPGGSPLVSGLSTTSYDDMSGLPTVTYYYFVVAKNNCPGTALTPMSTTSAVSAAIAFPACGATVGTIQGTVTASGAPLAGVAISASPYSTTTDANGTYSIGPIPTSTYTVTATKSGYDVNTANNVAVVDGQTTVQNFAMIAASAGSCFADTTRTQFEAGTLTNIDSSSSPGDLKLSLTVPEGVDQHADDNGFGSGFGFTSTSLIGQTFTPSVTATLTKVDASMFCASCSGTNPNLTLEVRTTSGGFPVMTAGGLLASATIAGFSSGSSSTKTFVFATPPTLTAATQYGIVVKLVSNRTTGTQAWISSSGDVMAGGRRLNCTTSACSNPTGSNNNSDLIFAAYMKSTTFQTSANLVSSVKDSNPVAGAAPQWTTLSWTATTPANTTVKFQAAGSNNAAGPFTFVGPDGTAATFFTTSGASLAQFNGSRYLKYKALLSTTDNTATPTLSDVTVCSAFADCTSATPTVTPGAAQVCSGSTGNTASGTAGMASYAWSITNGTITGGGTTQTVTYTAGASGTVNLGLAITTSAGCSASSSANVSINFVPAATVSAGGPTTFCAGGSVTLTSSSAAGNQWYLNGGLIGGAVNQQYVATASGNYTTVVTSSGCSSAPSSPTSVTVNPIPATPTITPGGPTTFCTGGSVTLTSSSATGNQWSLNGNPIGGATSQAYSATASGNYTVIVTTNGCASAASSATTVTVNPIPATPTITPGGPTTFCAGGSVTLTSSSATGNQWSLNGNPIGGATNQAYSATASGNYTVVVTASGCSSAASSATTVTVNPIPATPTITPGGPTTFCAGGSVTLTSSSATGNQWYLEGNPIGGATNQAYSATASGNYTVIVTTSGCSSAASSPTSVTVNPIPATPTITPGGPTTFCAGGSVTLTSSSATGNQWSLNGNPIGGATNQAYSATASGNYTVIVTTSGCSSAASSATSVTVNPIPATPTITPGGPTTFCAGGSVTLTSSSATGNQWYLEGNPIGGATNQAYSATASGNYTVIVTTSGCASAASSATTVTVNPIPATPTITPGGPTTFCASGSVTLTSSSATGNQWYLEGNPISGAANQTYSATASGNYTVIVTANGCNSAASSATTVTVNPTPATPTITPSGPTTFCAGGSVTLTSSSASGNQWYLNGNPIGGETNQTYVATASGNYTVVVTASGCASAAASATTVTVNATPATPTITPGGPTTFCAGGSVTLTSSSASGNQWYLGGNPISGATNQAYSATASGNYTVIVTTSGCSSAASSATSVTVNPIPATPTITPSGPTTFCTGGSVTLTSSSASGNQWYLNGNPIGGETNQTYVATASGNYTVIVTASGCASAASAATTVTVNAIPTTPTITPGGPTTFCAGGSVTLTSSSATGNQWSLNGNPISGATNQAYSATASGNYTVIVTTSGCSSAASSATSVTVNPIPATPTITPSGPTTFCAGGSVTLTSSSASGNQWYLNGNPIGGATNQAYSATASGNYTVTVTATGCTSAASAATAVTVNPIPATPTITPSVPTTFCTGGSVTLTSSSASGNQWYLGGNPIASATNQTLVVTAAGSYTVVVTAAGCSSAPSAATVVTVNTCVRTRSDLNANGMSDIVLQNTNTSSVAAWLMEDNTLVEGKVVANPTPENQIVATGDLDGDAKHDIIVKNNTTGAISMWKMNGTALVSQTVIATPNIAQRVVATRDFNHDGKDDIVLQHNTTGAVSLWLMDGPTLVSGIALGNPGANVRAITLGKLGGDAIVFQNNDTGAITRWVITGTSVTSNQPIATPAAGWKVAATGDFDGDADDDLALQQTGTRTVSVWLLDAAGTTIVQGAVVATPVPDWKVVGAGDYNGNGRGDLLLHNPATNGIAQWQMNGVVIERGWNVGTIAGWVPLGN